MRRFGPRLAPLSLVLLLCAFEWPARLREANRLTRSVLADDRAAALALAGALDADAATAVVVPLLSDREAGIRIGALRIIGTRRLTAALPALFPLLSSTDTPTKMAAIATIGEIGGEQAEVALTRALGDRSSEVRRAAVLALGRAAGAKPLPLPIALRLDDEDGSVRRAALAVVGAKADKRMLIPLMGKLSDPAQEIRVLALEALERLADPAGEQAIIRALGDSAPEVRESAANALGAIGPKASPRATEALIPLTTGYQDSGVAASAIAALGQLKHTAGLDALIDLLDRPDRAALASNALSLAGAEAAWRLLLPQKRALSASESNEHAFVALSNAERFQRWAAAESVLNQLGTQAISPAFSDAATMSILDELDRMNRDQVSAVMSGPDPATMRLLNHLAKRLRPGIASATRLTWSAVEWLEHKNSATRLRALAILQTLAADAASDRVEPIMADSDPDLRAAAVGFVVRNAKAKTAENAAENALMDPDRFVADSAVSALRKRQRAAPRNSAVTLRIAKLAFELAETSEPQLRQQLISLLVERASADDIAHLLAVSQDSAAQCGSALKILGAIARAQKLDASTKQSLHAFAANSAQLGRDISIRLFAIDLLGALGSPRAIETLSTLLRDPVDDVRAAALLHIPLSASAIGADVLTSITARAADDPSMVVRAAAQLRRAAPQSAAAAPATYLELVHYEGSPIAFTPIEVTLPGGRVLRALSDIRGIFSASILPAEAKLETPGLVLATDSEEFE